MQMTGTLNFAYYPLIDISDAAILTWKVRSGAKTYPILVLRMVRAKVGVPH